MKLKVYISGPVTGRDPITTAAIFERYEKAILDMNMCPVNPLKLGCEGTNWNDDMKICLEALLKCNLIMNLEDWQTSEGARLENQVASALNINQLKIRV